MSRFERRLKESLVDPQHRAAYFAADAEAQLTKAVNTARKALDVSQSELGERLEKSQAAVSQFLNAEDGITIERLVEYLLALELEADIKIRLGKAGVRPVKVSLDLWEPLENVYRIARATLKAQIRQEPPRLAEFGKPREAMASLKELTEVAQPGAA